MLVRQIHLGKVMSHDSTRLDLPDRGVTVIVGENGEGKSTILEAVSMAFWNKTLRGTSPWRQGEAGFLRVVTDEHDITRTITAKGTVNLEWFRVTGLQQQVKADTKAELNKKLAEEAGDWDRWRKTHIFSSSDAAHFSSATDAQRKALIESVLGMEAFDTALEKCRADIRRIEQEKRMVDGNYNRVLIAFERMKSALENWQDYPPFEEEPEPQQPCEQIDTGLKVELETQLSELEQARSTASRAGMATVPSELIIATTKARSAHDRAKEEQARVAKGNCEKCNRPFVQRDAEKAMIAVDEAFDALKAAEEREAAARAECTRQRQNSAHEVESLSEEIRKVQIDLGRVNEHLTMYSRWERDRAAWKLRQDQRRARYNADVSHRQKQKAEVEAELKDYELGLKEESQKADALNAELAVLIACEKVLGMRGVRVQVMAHALTGIEHVANGWLQRMAPGVTLELKPYTETKTSGVNDQLSLLVNGFGGGYGYKASSGGERRRIDIALILGLAEVNSAAEGKQVDGTLFMDEVFDAVSAAHTGAVAECLTELGRTRSLVVITHRTDLAAAIDAVQRFEAIGGKLRAI